MRGSFAAFVQFTESLTLPTGQRFVLESFQKLILREVWNGRRELLVLLPRGNGKTMIFAALAVYHLLTTPNAECYIGAANREQASQLYRYAAHFVESEPELARLVKVLDATRTLRSKRDQGFVRVLASDDSKTGGKHHSYAPTLALVDELHAHEHDALYIALRTALGKRDGLIVVITTAGHDEETTLGQLRVRALELEVRQVRAERLIIATSRDGKFVMFEWASLPEDDTDDPEIVKFANPASFVTVGWLAEQLAAPAMTHEAFLRFHCNVWASADDIAIKPAVWAACEEKGLVIPDGAPVFLGLDLAHVTDTTALVPVWRRDGPPAIAHARIFAPPGDGDPMRFEPVIGAIKEAAARWQVLGVVFDRYGGAEFFAQVLEGYEDVRLPFVDMPQRKEHQTAFSQTHYEAVQSRGVAHDGDPTLARHVSAAGLHHYPDGTFRYVKARRSRKPIDGLIAGAMALRLALAKPPRKSGPLFERLL